MNWHWWLGFATGFIAATLIFGFLDTISGRFFRKVQTPEVPVPVGKPYTKCPFCELGFTPRGMSNHLRVAHPGEYKKDAATA